MVSIDIKIIGKGREQYLASNKNLKEAYGTHEGHEIIEKLNPLSLQAPVL